MVGCRDNCGVEIAAGAGVSVTAGFVFLRCADDGPFGLLVRGLRGFFSFGGSSDFILGVASGSFFLRGFFTFSVAGVVVFLAFADAFSIAVWGTTPSDLRFFDKCATVMLSGKLRLLPFVWGDGIGESEESELSSNRLASSMIIVGMCF